MHLRTRYDYGAYTQANSSSGAEACSYQGATRGNYPAGALPNSWIFYFILILSPCLIFYIHSPRPFAHNQSFHRLLHLPRVFLAACLSLRHDVNEFLNWPAHWIELLKRSLADVIAHVSGTPTCIALIARPTSESLASIHVARGPAGWSKRIELCISYSTTLILHVAMHMDGILGIHSLLPPLFDLCHVVSEFISMLINLTISGIFPCYYPGQTPIWSSRYLYAFRSRFTWAWENKRSAAAQI